jgi:hypothetical protein
MRIRDPGWRQFGSGIETVRIRDSGWEKVGSGIRDKHPGSATLYFWLEPDAMHVSRCWRFTRAPASTLGVTRCGA